MNWKNRFGLFLVLVATCSLLFGCRTMPLGMVPVKEPAQRYTLKDFSISAPAGEGWYVQMQGENAIRFFKAVDDASAHTLVAVVKPFGFSCIPGNNEELIKLLKEGSEKELKDSNRYRDGRMEAFPDGKFGDLAVRTHEVAKNFPPAGLPSGAKYLILDRYCHYFRIPKSNTFLIIWYSERSRPQDADPALREKADRFFESFQFAPAEKKP